MNETPPEPRPPEKTLDWQPGPTCTWLLPAMADTKAQAGLCLLTYHHPERGYCTVVVRMVVGG